MLHWFAKRLKEGRENEKGFTLIELLVVVIIIGVLAAIAVPVFLEQRERSFGAALRSDTRNGAAAATAYAAAPANNGSFTGMTGPLLTGTYGWNLSTGVSITSVTPTGGGNSFTLVTTHAQADATEDVCTFDSTNGVLACA